MKNTGMEKPAHQGLIQRCLTRFGTDLIPGGINRSNLSLRFCHSGYPFALFFLSYFGAEDQTQNCEQTHSVSEYGSIRPDDTALFLACPSKNPANSEMQTAIKSNIRKPPIGGQPMVSRGRAQRPIAEYRMTETGFGSLRRRCVGLFEDPFT
jgi:hypothetical protein